MKLTSRLWMGLTVVVLTVGAFECRAMNKGESADDEEKLERPKSAKGRKKPSPEAPGASRTLNVSPEDAAEDFCQSGRLSGDVLRTLLGDPTLRDTFFSQLSRRMADLEADSRNLELVFLPSPSVTGYVKHPDGSFSCTKGGVLDRRALAHYEQYPQIPGLGTGKRAVVGGAHLTPQEAFGWDEAAAREGKSSSSFFEPVGHMNVGCVVFNKDEGTKPDHREDFTEPGVITKLALEGRFNNVTFENVPPSLTFNEEALLNAYQALEPGGFFYAFPIPDMPDAIQELERRIGSVGFEGVKFSPKSRYFLTHKPPLDIGSVMARKPKGKL